MLDMTKRHKMFLKLTAPLMCSTYVAFIFISKLFKCIKNVDGMLTKYITISPSKFICSNHIYQCAQ